jgi:hypothetical protein
MFYDPFLENVRYMFVSLLGITVKMVLGILLCIHILLRLRNIYYFF